MRTLITATTILLGAYGCDSIRTSKWDLATVEKEIDFDLKVTVYNGDGEVVVTKYLDRNQRVIEQLDRESRAQFRYNDSGQLMETHNCRHYNCELGWKEVMSYDSSGQLLGSFILTVGSPDTIAANFKQTRFYDGENRLIKERTDIGTDVYGNRFENWKYYSYSKGRINSEVNLINLDTVWVGNYYYGDSGNLQRILRQKDATYHEELFAYDSLNRLIKKTVRSNKVPLEADTYFAVDNSATSFLYNQQGQLVEETTTNHRGTVYSIFTYVYKRRK